MAFEATFKRVDDILWKEAGCTTELDYTEQTSWMLFLKYLDNLEQENVKSPFYVPLSDRVSGIGGRMFRA